MIDFTMHFVAADEAVQMEQSVSPRWRQPLRDHHRCHQRGGETPVDVPLPPPKEEEARLKPIV